MTYPDQPGLFIGGEWLSGGGRDTQPVLNPATGAFLADLSLVAAADLDRALEAAERGFSQWRTVAPEARGAVLREAAALLAGGENRDGAGYFFSPTVLADVPRAVSAMNDEPFGPVALLSPFATLEEAVKEANRLPYGLAAYCFTENGRRQMLLGDTAGAGMVMINQVRTTWPDAPFGGVRESGFGSEDGPEGLMAYMATKAVHVA